MGKVCRIVFFGLVALAVVTPFLVMGAFLLRAGGDGRGGGKPAGASAPMTLPLGQWFAGAKNPMEGVKNHPKEAIQAVGSKDSLWIYMPAVTPDGREYFQLMSHAAGEKENGKDTWELTELRGSIFIGAPASGIAPNLPKLPSLMAAQVPPFGGDMPSSAVVFYDDGHLTGYSVGDEYELPYLPEGQRPVAVAGGGDRGQRVLLALTRGPRVAATQGATQEAGKMPGLPGAATVAATATASTAAASASAPAAGAADQWSLFQRDGNKWMALPGPGLPGGEGPSLDARIVMALQQERLWLLWYEPGQPEVLKAKALPWHTPAGGWAATIETNLGEAMTKIQVVTLPQMVLLWPVAVAGKDTLAMRGVTLSPEGKVDMDVKEKGKPHILTMDLGETSKGADPSRDIAACQFSNSIAVLVQGFDGKDGTMHELLFAPDGTANGGAVEAMPGDTGTKPSPWGGNSTFVVLMVLMALSLWYWRRQPAVVSFPKGVQIAALGQRMAAGLIDLSVPLVIVVLAYGLYDTPKWNSTWTRLMRAVSQGSPEQSTELLVFLAIYVTHVTISELVNGQSLGKMVFGLKVIGLDGRKAKPGAVLVRNMIRIVEVIPGPMLLVMVLTPLRQRVGDIIARTLVVQLDSMPPEAPGDR